MERKFKILDTEDTRECFGGLIGMTFNYIGMDDHYIKLDTCDGELLFWEDEVQEV